jgi:hypothetical protein
MARKKLFNIAEADTGRPAYEPFADRSQLSPQAIDPAIASAAEKRRSPRRQDYREGKRAVMFFLPEEAFSQMHVLLARQGRKKVQTLMEELVDDWFRRENAPRVIR